MGMLKKIHGLLFTGLLATSLLQAAEAPGWKVALEPVGNVKCNYPADFHVKLQDSKGAPVEGADVQLVLTMVEMNHGEFKTGATAVKPGVYDAKPTFYMVGKWTVEVRAKKGDQSLSEKIPFEVND